MSWTHLPRYLFALLIPGMLAPAQAQILEPVDSLLSVGAIPLASAEGYRFPRDYPCLDIGLGLHTFNPGLSGLSEVYGGTPSFGLSPALCIMVELACSDAIGIQVDAGTSIRSNTNKGYEGLAGLVSYFRPFSNPDLRPYLSAGVAVCSFRGEAFGIVTEAGATGFHASAGLEYLLGRGGAVDIYGGYCSYPRVSAIYSVLGGRTINASTDLSNVIVGLRLKWLM